MTLELNNVYHMDALTLLKALPDNSVDAVVTDPPAGIAFMNKEWDKDKGGRKEWITWMQTIAAEALRVLKPGGHALVWSIPRTSHWTGIAWEDAGFEPRDKVYHTFGSGFPKGTDISKQIDKKAGAVREAVDTRKKRGAFGGVAYAQDSWTLAQSNQPLDLPITAPATPEAQAWHGWNSALKPAVEEWWMFRKPLIGTLAANTLEWGVGGLHVDACRVEYNEPFKTTERTAPRFSGRFNNGVTGGKQLKLATASPQGRWPANLVHDGSDEVVGMFPVTGAAKSGQRNPNGKFNTNAFGDYGAMPGIISGHDDNGGSAARFFYCAKASKKERGEGNTHPTVKSIALMEWLIKLVTPEGALIVDPFAGSGTTLIAAKNLGRQYIGGDITAEYVEIARKRLTT